MGKEMYVWDDNPHRESRENVFLTSNLQESTVDDNFVLWDWCTEIKDPKKEEIGKIREEIEKLSKRLNELENEK